MRANLSFRVCSDIGGQQINAILDGSHPLDHVHLGIRPHVNLLAFRADHKEGTALRKQMASQQ